MSISSMINEIGRTGDHYVHNFQNLVATFNNHKINTLLYAGVGYCAATALVNPLLPLCVGAIFGKFISQGERYLNHHYEHNWQLVLGVTAAALIFYNLFVPELLFAGAVVGGALLRHTADILLTMRTS